MSCFTTAVGCSIICGLISHLYHSYVQCSLWLILHGATVAYFLRWLMKKTYTWIDGHGLFYRDFLKKGRTCVSVTFPDFSMQSFSELKVNRSLSFCDLILGCFFGYNSSRVGVSKEAGIFAQVLHVSIDSCDGSGDGAGRLRVRILHPPTPFHPSLQLRRMWWVPYGYLLVTRIFFYPRI